MTATFKKIYFLNKLTTKLDSDGKESKNLLSLLPKGYKKPEFDYSQPWIKSKNTCIGHAVVTGKLNNITVLDFDNMEVYRTACEMVPDLHKYHTVQTRRGMHVYFEYDESISKTQKVKKIDVQTKGKLIIGQDTLLNRYTGQKVMYQFLGGKIMKMPTVLRDWCCNVDESKVNKRKDFETNIDYNYDATDEECRYVLDMMVNKHREYFTDYDKWIMFTAVMKTINKRELWDEYSEKYDNANYNRYKNANIWRKMTMKLSLNYFCHLLSIPAFKYHKTVAEDELYNEIEYNEETYREICLKYINIDYDEFRDNDTIILESGTGTGKTTCVSRLVKALQNEERCTILSIVNLISLAKQQKITFAKSGVNLTLYNEDKANPAVIMSHDACICVNSLGQLSDCNFKNKIVYIDEIYSLCMTLSHNETVKNQRQVFNTLYRIITQCKKLIVSDAHIHNNVMSLLATRLNKKCVHYYNSFKKFHGTPAIRYNDENEFFNILQSKILKGETFSFGSDSKSIIEKWYTKLFNSASVEVQQDMLLYTSETSTDVLTDWNNKFIFYSPKFTTGVDITCINSSEQFMYITGQSVSSINLLQMATRTRNMNQLNYYSSVRSSESLYENFNDCCNKVREDFVSNRLGFSFEDIEEFQTNHTFTEVENIYMNLYERNCYALDLHSTNILYFFEDELKHCGFIIGSSVGKTNKMDAAIKAEFKEQSQIIRDEKFEMLLESFNLDENVRLPTSIKPMVERCKLLNLTTYEDVAEYRELIEDPHVLEHFFNYNGLNKSYSFIEAKVKDTTNKKMITGIQKNHWFKIKYVHILAKVCGIEDNIFDIENIVMPKQSINNGKLIDAIKKLYQKRDKTPDGTYTIEYIKQLYKFMIDNLTKKLKLVVSKQSMKKDTRNEINYSINEELKLKYDKLIVIMNHNQPSTYEFPEEND